MPSALVFKAVKPKKLKVDAFRLEFLTMLHKAEREMKKDFEKTTSTWDEDVEFESQISLKGGPTLLVGTDNETYALVNDGAPPHRIYPKRKKSLQFQTGYKPKSSPGVIGAVQGGKFGETVKRAFVNHPGHEARKFDITIQKMWKKKFKRMAEDAMRKAARKSGHG